MYQGKDFEFVESSSVMLGSRKKEFVLDNNSESAFFKYNGYDGCTELASEKIACEIAKFLGYRCARIELAVDSIGNLGILNYLFVAGESGAIHYDFSFYLNIKNSNDRKERYTLSYLKSSLDSMNVNLFEEFIKLLIFDSLIGEQDRHEQNWGVIYDLHTRSYEFSPFYDNGCCLMREQTDEKLMKFQNSLDEFEKYIWRSKTFIYQDGKRLKHFDLIYLLLDEYPDVVIKEINKLHKLNDFVIENFVNCIPKNYLTELHKKYIIEYIKRRRDILLEISKKASEDNG